MKIKILTLGLIYILTISVSIIHASPKDTTPGKYNNWGRMINDLEIIKSFKATNYSKLNIQDIDISNIQYQLDEFSADKKAEIVKQGIRILLDRIKNKVQNLEVIISNTEKSTKALVLRISITFIGVETVTKWWSPLARVEIQGELLESQSDGALLKFTTQRASTVKGLSESSNLSFDPSKNSEAQRKDLIIVEYTKAINNDFKELGDDVVEMLFSFK